MGYSYCPPGSWQWAAAYSPNLVGGYPNNTAIAADAGGWLDVIWLEWQSNGNNYDRIGRFRFQHGSWSPPSYFFTEANFGNEELAPTVEIAASTSGSYPRAVAYASFSDWEHRVYCQFEEASGGWTGMERITTASDEQWYPALTAAGRDFHFAWLDSRGSIYVRSYITP